MISLDVTRFRPEGEEYKDELGNKLSTETWTIKLTSPLMINAPPATGYQNFRYASYSVADEMQAKQIATVILFG